MAFSKARTASGLFCFPVSRRAMCGSNGVDMARPAEEQGWGQDIRQVDASTFEALVAQHSAEVAQLANRLLGWPGDVDDVVQDVFFAAYRARAGFRGQCLVRTWLFAIAINRCRSLQRRQRLHRMALFRMAQQTQASGQEVGRSDDEYVLQVRQALARLPRRYREPAVLWYLQEMPADEICQVLGVAKNTLYVRLARARERLRGLLTDTRNNHE
jgi:RNA polymerase sigma-70 factor (ECF subfamily)